MMQNIVFTCKICIHGLSLETNAFCLSKVRLLPNSKKRQKIAVRGLHCTDAAWLWYVKVYRGYCSVFSDPVWWQFEAFSANNSSQTQKCCSTIVEIRRRNKESY